jgi:aldehyde dehydrogenase (NAD+)
MIAFTGSAPNGRRIAEVSAKTLKRLLLELGGKSAYVVLESANVAEQAATAAKLICANAGQGCVARSRLLVPRSRHGEAVAAALATMKGITIGDPSDPKVFMGPLISKHHRARVLSLIERARGQSELAYGGGIPAHMQKGYFIEPTLFVDVKPDDIIAQEEAFAPVLAIIPYDDRKDALAIANNSEYGLSATVVASTDEEAIEFAYGLRTGTVSINGGVWMNLDVPFGGYKQSGLGRQFGMEGLAPYMETKVFGAPTGKSSSTLAWGETKKP